MSEKNLPLSPVNLELFIDMIIDISSIKVMKIKAKHRTGP